MQIRLIGRIRRVFHFLLHRTKLRADMDPRVIFDMFNEDMMEDFLYKRRHVTNMSQKYKI